MMRQCRSALFPVAALVAASLLAGCGSDDGSGSGDNTSSGPTTSAADSGDGGGDGSSADDPCALLGDTDLTQVFGDNPIPEPEDGSVGAGYYGCEWELDADDMDADDFNVTIAIVPIDSLESDYLSKMTSLGDIDGVADGHSFDGTVGVMGGSTRGHSVSFSVGEVGGFVGVQKGNHGDPDTEIDLATEFTKKVVAQLG